MLAFENLEVVVKEGFECLEIFIRGKLSFAVIRSIDQMIEKHLDSLISSLTRIFFCQTEDSGWEREAGPND
jgi:hypothetical protein